MKQRQKTGEAAPPGIKPSAKPAVLIVDDSSRYVGLIAKELLKAFGENVEILAADNFDQAELILRRERHRLCAVITDNRFYPSPPIEKRTEDLQSLGQRMVEAARRTAPAAAVILESSEDLAGKAAAWGAHGFLRKDEIEARGRELFQALIKPKNRV